MSQEQIPNTDSIRELASFWDTHDLTDFDDQLNEVSEPVFERDTAVTVHFQPDEVEAVKKIAHSQGVGDADLIRQWVLEKLHVS